MKRRRWVVVGLAVAALAAVFFVVALRIEPSPPFKFIKGPKVHTDARWVAFSHTSKEEFACYDYYVFPASVEFVRKEAAKELAPLGYQTEYCDESVWVWCQPDGSNQVAVGGASLWPLWVGQSGRWAEVPPGSVVVRVARSEPNFIERVQEWARGIGL